MSRGEWRTEQGWQRFDRVAFIVSLLLMLALLIVWFSGVVAEDTDAPDTVIAATDTSDATDAARQQPADTTPAENATSNGQDKPLVAGRQDAESSEEPSGQESDQADTASTGQSAGNNAARPGGNPLGDAETETDKSLASQDPARQATFERIPKHLDQPIAIEASESAQTAPDTTAATALAGKDAAAQEQNSAADRLPATVLTDADGPKVTPILELRSADGALTIDGIVSSDALRAGLLKAGLTAYGMRNLNNRLAVNAAVAPFEWSGDAADLILLVGGPESETTLRIDGNTVTLAGEVPALQDKQARALAAQQFFGTRARVDNRLRVVSADTGSSASQQASADRLNVDGLGQKAPAPPAAAETSREAPLAAVVPASGDQNTATDANLAEGGPGQVDSVTLLPSGLPKRIARGDCPRVATSVLIPFGSASVTLTEAARAALDQLAPCLSRRNYLVGGHTDNRGSPANNRALSKERAQAVVDYLVDAGVPAGRVTAVGYGESRPIISNRSERGRARNRRVDFRFKR